MTSTSAKTCGAAGPHHIELSDGTRNHEPPEYVIDLGVRAAARPGTAQRRSLAEAPAEKANLQAGKKHEREPVQPELEDREAE